MKKLLIVAGVLILSLLTACTTTPESPAKPSEVITSTSAANPGWQDEFNKPLTDDEIPASDILKFGQAFIYVHGLKITITKPEQDGAFTVVLDAPKGWLKESDNKEERSQVIVSTVGEPIFKCDGPFSETLLPGTVKTYNCTAQDFGKESTDYLGVMVADFVIPTWTKTGQPY